MLWVGALLVGLTGCKGVGTVCSQSGSTSECNSDNVCTFVSRPATFDPNAAPPPPLSVCLRRCTETTDCGEGELCRVALCSTLKSCQTGPLQDPPPDICEGVGGAGGSGGTAGVGGAAGMGGTGGGGEPRVCESEARAYIQTLDPSSGFNRTNFVPFDTTDLPDDWQRYSISLDLTDGALDGQIVQFGFTAVASNFDPSGVFYDNVVIETGDAGGGGGAGGAGGDSGGGTLVTEYDQDFESLDQESDTALSDDPNALWGDGWIVFANVFSADGTTLQYFYGPDPAPNNSGAFSGVALDEGGAGQGAQQLVIISDYNNPDQQGTGLRIEANTFRERSIVSADIGNTLVVSFDAKRGNINSPDEGCLPP